MLIVSSDAKEIKTFLFGGIGNQLFQYAFGLKIAEEIGGFVSLDLRGRPTRGQQKGSNITELKIGSKKSYMGQELLNYLVKIPMSRVFRDSPSPVSDFVLGIAHPDSYSDRRVIKVAQYAQHRTAQNYFDGMVPISLKERPSSRLLEDYSIVESRNVLTIHHRLGDTLRLRDSRGLLGKEFFTSALQRSQQISSSIDHVHVHTDSMSLSEKLLDDWLPATTKSYAPQDLSAAEVLTSLARARNLVLSNSTLSWWAAAAGMHTMVFSPNTWDVRGDTSLILDSWITIDPSWE